MTVKKLQSVYRDGLYEIINSHGVETLIEVRNGVVYVVGGFGGGSTGTNLESFVNNGCKIIAQQTED